MASVVPLASPLADAAPGGRSVEKGCGSSSDQRGATLSESVSVSASPFRLRLIPAGRPTIDGSAAAGARGATGEGDDEAAGSPTVAVTEREGETTMGRLALMTTARGPVEPSDVGLVRQLGIDAAHSIFEHKGPVSTRFTPGRSWPRW
jgi:hypothetical protein